MRERDIWRKLRETLGLGVAAAALAGPWGGTAGAQREPRQDAPALEPAIAWLNTARPLRFDDELRGHVVLLDFWTHCCINCMHVLPDLAYLEDKYADDPFVVIGVHSAKFTGEGERESVRHAVARYGIEHPVVIDDGMGIWKTYGAASWPTFVLIGADGMIIGQTSGEGKLGLLDSLIREALGRGRTLGTLADERVEIQSDAMFEPVSGLRFPGKVEAIPGRGGKEGFLLIADSGHGRIVETTWPDDEGRCRVARVFGRGTPGFENGAAESAAFHDPQGMCVVPGARRVYVADRENHAVRAIDRSTGWVTTAAGSGERGHDRTGGRVGVSQEIASPWDVVAAEEGERLLIAMAGAHQLWEMLRVGLVVRAIAGSGSENSVDGWAPDAALAQPSALALSGDGRRLYFADSESSSVRVLDLDENVVRTIVGHAVEGEFENGLFEYGDVDGMFPEARLQHPLGIALMPTGEGERLLVADTYNHKIKLVDPEERSIETWVGAGRGRDAPAGTLVLDEPGGVEFAREEDGRGWVIVADTNNHRIVMVDAATKQWRELMISGLEPVRRSGTESPARMVIVGASPGEATGVTAGFDLGAGRRVNREMPASIRVTALRGAGREVLAQRTVRTSEPLMAVEIPEAEVREGDRWLIEVSMAWCDDDAGVCVPVEARWIVMLETDAEARAIRLVQSID